LDTDPGQLAQKGIFSHRLIQFHRHLCSHLTQKGHLCTLFALPFFPQLCSNSQSRGPFFFLNRTCKDVVYRTQKTMLKNAITNGFTMMGRSSVGDQNLSKKGTTPVIIGSMA
jgi:hypothetical protein